MIDLHCHLLHGVDDGPTNLAASIDLCRLSVADGISHAITTPHFHAGRWENTVVAVRTAVQELQNALTEQSIPLQLGVAGEVRLSDQLMSQFEAGELPFYGELGGYKIMLLEFPHGQIIPGSEKLVNWLMANGVRPLIAHPERNKQLMKNVALLKPFLEAGCWLQLTAGSVTGDFGERAQAVSRYLLECDSVAVVASDAHNSSARPPRLSIAYDYICSKYSEQQAQKLLIDTPAAISADQFPDPAGLSSRVGAL